MGSDTYIQTTMTTTNTTNQLSSISVKRISREIRDLAETPGDGFWVLPNENNMADISILIEGPTETPYEGGYYFFKVTLPNNYPFKHPTCKYMTTGNGVVRFNPNLYKCGKVCLSILGTWSGPEWTSAMSIRTLCMNLQLILNNNPIQNEPSYETTKLESDSAQQYNKYVSFCSMKYAALEHIKKSTNLPKEFQEIVEDRIKSEPERYLKLVENYKASFKDYAATAGGCFSSDCHSTKYVWDELLEEMKSTFDIQQSSDNVDNTNDPNNNKPEEARPAEVEIVSEMIN